MILSASYLKYANIFSFPIRKYYEVNLHLLSAVIITQTNKFGTSVQYNKEALSIAEKPQKELQYKKYVPPGITLPQEYRGPKGKILTWIESFLSKRGLERTRKLAAAYYTYESYIDFIDIEEFFIEFDLPDTFASWFAIVEMHVWAMSARMMTDTEDASYKIRDTFVEAFWIDADTRSSRLGDRATLHRKKHLSYLASAFQAAFFGYDEGIQSNDMVLAAMIWRRIFARECTDAEKIERLVKYLRVQVDHLSKMSLTDITMKRTNLHVPLSEVHITS